MLWHRWLARVGRQEGHLACKKLGIGLLTVVTFGLDLCTSYSSSCVTMPNMITLSNHISVGSRNQNLRVQGPHPLDWSSRNMPHPTCSVPILVVLGQTVWITEQRSKWKMDLSYQAFQGHSRSSEQTDRLAIYDFLSVFHSSHGPILYRFRDKKQFQSKIWNFPSPV